MKHNEQIEKLARSFGMKEMVFATNQLTGSLEVARESLKKFADSVTGDFWNNWTKQYPRKKKKQMRKYTLTFK